VRKVLPGELKSVKVKVCCGSLGVQSLCEPQVRLITHGVCSENFLKAILSPCEVLSAEVNVAKFEPGLLVDLIDLEVLIKHRNGIIDEIIVLVERNKTLHCL